MKRQNRFLLFPGLTVILCAVLIFNAKARAADPPVKRLAQIPFTVNAKKELGYLKKGMVNMMYSRLSWRDHVVVIPQNIVDKELNRIGRTLSESERVAQIAKQTGSAYVLTGSVTQMGGSFSIDAKVFDISNQQYMAFFEQSDTRAELISKLDRIAAVINKKVFKRTTLTWDRIEEERQAKINEMKRKNPEYLMQNPGWQKTEEKIGWKIWKYLF